jgi:uncharacterized protein YbjQ (UPF0145 family)
MITTTTPNVDGRRVVQYLGVVSGECVAGTNIFADFFASVRDIFGGRSGAYQQILRQSRDEALADMEAEAQKRGANAIVGVDLDYNTISSDRKTLLYVVASGTAVLLE